MLTSVNIIAMSRFSSAAAFSLVRISACWSLGIVLLGDVGVRERESIGIVSGYVGGRMTCRENCAGVSWGLYKWVRGSGLSVSGMTRIRYSVGDISGR